MAVCAFRCSQITTNASSTRACASTSARTCWSVTDAAASSAISYSRIAQRARRSDRSSPVSHTHTFNGPMSGTTRVSRYQKGKTNLDFTEARDSEWQWHQLQVCTSLQTDNHANTSPLSFLQVGCPSCRPTNSVKALKAQNDLHHYVLLCK